MDDLLFDNITKLGGKPKKKPTNGNLPNALL